MCVNTCVCCVSAYVCVCVWERVWERVLVCSIHEYNSNIIRVEYTNRVVDVACVGQSEARDTMKLLKLLPPDVSAELIEVVCI